MNHRRGDAYEAHHFSVFIADSEYLCGHNIILHDSKYIEVADTVKYIDTLFLSPLLFPNKPYHALVKDDKLQTDELNNPLNDAIKAKECISCTSTNDEKHILYMILLLDLFVDGKGKKILMKR